MANAKTLRIRAYFRALAREGVTDLPNPFHKPKPAPAPRTVQALGSRTLATLSGE